MSMTSKKIYTIDGKPVSPIGLIEAATELDKPFASLPIKRTSIAAAILRKYGHKVGRNDAVQTVR